LLAGATAALCALGVDYLLIRARVLHFAFGLSPTAEEGLHPYLLHEAVAAVVVLATVGLGAWALGSSGVRDQGARPARPAAGAFAALALIAALTLAFSRTALREPPPGDMTLSRWQGTFDRAAVYGTYLEYLRIPGQHERKAELRGFLVRSGIPEEALPSVR
jgi:hypothetical protein